MEDPAARLRQEALLFEYAQCQDEANSIALRVQAIIIVIYSGSVLGLTSGIGSQTSGAYLAYSWIGFAISVVLMAPQVGPLGPGPVRFLQDRASFTRKHMFGRQQQIEKEIGFINKSSSFHAVDQPPAADEKRRKKEKDTPDYLAGRPAGIALMNLGWGIAFLWGAAAAITSWSYFSSR